jgi:hypothetical protein
MLEEYTGDVSNVLFIVFLFSLILLVLSTYMLSRKEEKLYENLTIIAAALTAFSFLGSLVLTVLYIWG